MFWSGFKESLWDENWTCNWEVDLGLRVTISKRELDNVPTQELENFFLSKKKEAALKALEGIMFILEREVPLPGEQFETELTPGDLEKIRRVQERREALAMERGAPPPVMRVQAQPPNDNWVVNYIDQHVENPQPQRYRVVPSLNGTQTITFDPPNAINYVVMNGAQQAFIRNVEGANA